MDTVWVQVSIASTRPPLLSLRRIETLNTVRVQFSAESTRSPLLSWRRVEMLCARSSPLSWRRVYASRFVREHDLQYLSLTSRIGRGTKRVILLSRPETHRQFRGELVFVSLLC
ncbi:hypothetical protein NDU88_006834 [Pleurodeles waltl]|uniref:Uncharacterized protein n=1 Tax=Pleurodeles waltl TaxID=8319 RepID=A0AAV7X2N6_PLEWA|nr:hypothetical protein NDU88_006834 [Pleurodeles waltl]